MRAVIKHNGKELPEASCTVNTASNMVTLRTMCAPDIILNPDRVYVEVNLFGELELLDDELED